MKEVIKCSISGIGFTLDADAYHTLRAYLDTLGETYGENPDGREIVADIEARIAELILTMQESSRVVEKPLIDDILRQMGSAEQIDEESSETAHRKGPRIPRRLYRDPEHAKLGGVCAGLGRYFDTDPAWIRLGIFLPLIFTTFSWIPFFSYHWSAWMGNLFAAFVFTYIVLWFAVPAARTARQKLEMKGERITVQSIRDTARSQHDVDGRTRSVLADVLSVFGQVVLVLLKILLGIILFGLICAACGLLIGIFAIAFNGTTNVFSYTVPAWMGIVWIVAVLVPLVLLIYVLMCLIASRKPGGKTVLAIFLVWIAVAIAAGIGLASVWRQIDDLPYRELPAPTRIEGNLMLEAEDAEDYPATEAPGLHISTPEAAVDLIVGKKGVSINVDDKRTSNPSPRNDTESAGK